MSRSGKRVRRSGWRRLLRVLVVVAVLLLIPMLVFLVWNRIDEAPSPTAQRFLASSPRQVADADNAWLAMIGIGAAPDVDPVVLGRRRVEALNARLASTPAPPADASEQALFQDAIAEAGPDITLDRAVSYCPSRDFDCLDWSTLHSAMLWRLRAANAVRLQRFERILTMPGWQMLYTPSSEMPFVDVSVAALHADLIALDLAASIHANDPKQSHPLTRLADSVEFWARVRSQPQDLVSIVLAGRRIEHAYWLVAAWLGQAAPDQVRAVTEDIDRILAAPAQNVDWSRAVAVEYQIYVRTLRTALPGPWGTLKRCFAATPADANVHGDGCLKSLAMTAAYAPQATQNMHARNLEQIQRVFEATPQTEDATVAEAGAVLESTFPRFEDTSELLSQMAFNFTGRVLASISIPAFDYHKREWDREALRRMVRILHLARLDQVPATQMQAFLQQQPKSLLNLLNDEAFSWDTARHTLYFEPDAEKYWKRERLELAYIDTQAPDVGACEVPLGFELFDEDDDPEAGQILRLFSCGGRGDPYWLSLMGDDLSMRERMPLIMMRRAGDAFELQLWRSTDHLLTAYRAWIEPAATGFDQVLEPVGMPDGPRIRVRSTSLQPPELVHLDVDNIGGRELARRIAAAKGLTLSGERHLGDARVSMHFDLTPGGALRLVAEHNGVELRERGPKHFEFVPSEASR